MTCKGDVYLIKFLKASVVSDKCEFLLPFCSLFTVNCQLAIIVLVIMWLMQLLFHVYVSAYDMDFFAKVDDDMIKRIVTNAIKLYF